MCHAACGAGAGRGGEYERPRGQYDREGGGRGEWLGRVGFA